MSPSIPDAINTHTPSLRQSSLRLATDGATGCTTPSATANDTITDLGAAAADFKVATSPPLRGPTAAPLLYSLGYGSTATPERQYAALSQTSRPVDAWLLRMRLAVVLSQQQEQRQKGEEATWPRYENNFYDDGSPPPEFWYTDPAASPSAHRDQSVTETHSSPDPPTPPPIQPTPTTTRKRTHDRLRVDDEHGCRQIVSELGPGKADSRRAKKRRMNETEKAC